MAHFTNLKAMQILTYLNLFKRNTIINAQNVYITMFVSVFQYLIGFKTVTCMKKHPLAIVTIWISHFITFLTTYHIFAIYQCMKIGFERVCTTICKIYISKFWTNLLYYYKLNNAGNMKLFKMTKMFCLTLYFYFSKFQ